MSMSRIRFRWLSKKSEDGFKLFNARKKFKPDTKTKLETKWTSISRTKAWIDGESDLKCSLKRKIKKNCTWAIKKWETKKLLLILNVIARWNRLKQLVKKRLSYTLKTELNVISANRLFLKHRIKVCFQYTVTQQPTIVEWVNLITRARAWLI